MSSIGAVQDSLKEKYFFGFSNDPDSGRIIPPDAQKTFQNEPAGQNNYFIIYILVYGIPNYINFGDSPFLLGCG